VSKVTLINCPDCGKLISNKAYFCISCGLPFFSLNNIIDANGNRSDKLEPFTNNNNNNKVPIWEKSNLTLAEAAEYSNIGINRLTMLIKNPRCNFVLNVGNKRLIKRKQFDDFINSVDFI